MSFPVKDEDTCQYMYALSHQQYNVYNTFSPSVYLGSLFVDDAAASVYAYN